MNGISSLGEWEGKMKLMGRFRAMKCGKGEKDVGFVME